MKIAAVITSRNDGYGSYLLERAYFALQTFIDSYDEVLYVDWCSPAAPLTDLLARHLRTRGNLRTIVVTKEDLAGMPDAALFPPMVEVLGRNIGIRRSGCDFIVSTNIDIVAARPQLSVLAMDTLYTAPRRDVPQALYLRAPRPDVLRQVLFQNLQAFPRKPDSVDETGNPTWDPNDRWSLVVSCGDYQLAHRSVWHAIRGFEEAMIHRSYADSNLMKKAALAGFRIAKLELPVFHLEHGYGNGAVKHNSQEEWVQKFAASGNGELWGLASCNLPERII